MSKKTVVLGVTGGIAAYKALDIVSSLKKNNIDVKVIMTENATEFVTALSFQALSSNEVITDMFKEPKVFEIAHISLAKSADLVVVAPATANIIGKVASGIADDMLTTTIMATKAPVVFAPAMNTNMYENKILKENIKKLKSYGMEFIEPASGRLACGDVGNGKLADTNEIVEIILSKLYGPKDFIGKKVLVTAGPTMAPIDPVRYITNHSSGKMGYAIAKEARDRGAEVVLISGETSIKPPIGVEFVRVNTNEEMYNAVMEYFEQSHIVIKCAAVSDYKPKEYSNLKIKKSSDEFSINFVKDRDILYNLGKLKKDQILVGFAAESNDLIKNAEVKLNKKNLDYIVLNDITSKDAGFAVDFNTVTVLGKDNYINKLPKMSKAEVAKELMDIVSTKI